MGSADEAAAIALLKRAVELDTSNRLTEAAVCYKEGIQLFLTVVQQIQDKNKKAKYREKAAEYLERCEVIDAKIRKDKEAGKFHEHVKIQSGSIGYGYETLFGRFLDEEVKIIAVEDPYIRSHHQIVNFLRCCELFVKKCSRLEEIKLTTSYDEINKAMFDIILFNQ